MKKNKEAVIKEIDERYSADLDDYIKQLDIVLEAETRIMNECGLIYPAIKPISKAIRLCIGNIKNILVAESNLTEEHKKILLEDSDESPDD